MDLRASFTSAGNFPQKLIFNLDKVVGLNRIVPLHVILFPTYRCNSECPSCSYGGREKNSELSLKSIQNIFDILVKRGTQAITLSGGGEPLMHPQINQIISSAGEKGLDVGLITNGLSLEDLTYHENLIWVRVSCFDSKDFPVRPMLSSLKTNPKTDWGLSYVITKKIDYNKLNFVLDFAKFNLFTHVRIIGDMVNQTFLPPLEEMEKNIIHKEILLYHNISSTPGASNCLFSLLKPSISPEGIYPCYNFVYALGRNKENPHKIMCRGPIDRLEEILDSQIPFDGSNCKVCYFSSFNAVLTNPEKFKGLNNLKELKHSNFI